MKRSGFAVLLLPALGLAQSPRYQFAACRNPSAATYRTPATPFIGATPSR